MKITLDNAVLAAGGLEGPQNFRVTQQRAVQVVDLVRSGYGGQRSRGNRRHVIAFGVTREHDSIRSAMQFILDHPGILPDSGLLLIQSLGADGTARRWFRDAILVRVDCVAQVGKTTMHQYELVAGEVLTRDPRRNPSA